MADEQATDVVDREESQNGTDDGGRSRLAGLTSKEILLPAAATAAAAAMAGLAAKKGPDLMKMLGGEADEEAEKLGRKGAQGAKSQLASGGGIAGKAASKLLGGGGGGAPSGGKTRRLPIQRWTDVAVPVEKAFKTWTQFEEFPRFMEGVKEVQQMSDERLHWIAEVGGEESIAVERCGLGISIGARRSGSARASGTVRSPTSGRTTGSLGSPSAVRSTPA